MLGTINACGKGVKLNKELSNPKFIFEFQSLVKHVYHRHIEHEMDYKCMWSGCKREEPFKCVIHHSSDDCVRWGGGGGKIETPY